MLTAAIVALGLTAVPPIPAPRPELAEPEQSVSVPEGSVEAVTPPPRDLSDQTIFEIILQDLERIGEPNDAQTIATPQDPIQRPSRPAVSTSDVAVSVPLPPARPVVLSPSAARKERSAGSVCGDPRLAGTMVSSVRGNIRACGIESPVRLTAVNGIKLTTPATLRCDAARTFADWLTGAADAQARKDLGAPISNVWVMASYSCRTRNHRKGARLSEHSFGRAIDVGGFVLANGRKITVLDNWGKGTPGRFLRSVWKRACGPFKTVLGPESDRFHRNHFHFDIAQRRSTFCR